MDSPHRAKHVSVFALFALLVACFAVAGCGKVGWADMTAPELAEVYSAILEDRYDEVFPDDRVQTVRISMDDADWQRMQGDIVGKVFYRADQRGARRGLHSGGGGRSSCLLIENFHDGYNNLYKPEIHAGALDWVEADAVAEATRDGGPSTTTTSPIYRVGGGDLGLIIDRLGEDAGWIPGLNGAGQTTTTTVAPPGNPMAGMQRLFNYDVDYLTSVGLRTNEEYADHSRLFGLLEVLNSDPAEVSTDDLEAVLDVDQVLRYLAASVALVHLDNYIGMGHNYYLYEDGGKFSLIPLGP